MCLGLTFGLTAQQSWHLQSLSPGQSAVSIQQLGDFNQAIVLQTNIGLAENATQVAQHGDANFVGIKQVSQNERLTVLQNGDANLYLLDSHNNLNTGIIVLQQGDRNTVRQELINSGNVEVQLEQHGNDNNLTHKVTGKTSQTIRVIQEGNGLNVSIIQGNGG